MTVEQIIQETRLWPASRIDELVTALTTQSKPAGLAPKNDGEAVARLRELSRKIDRVWAGTDVDISTDEMVASLREARTRIE
jgi:hypothetical protein